MQDKSLFELTIVSNLPVEPFLIPCVNRIFEQNEIQIRTVAVYYDEYDLSAALQRFSESNFIVILLNFENTYLGVLDEDSLTDVGAIVDFELEKAHRIWEAARTNSNASVLWFGYEDLQWNSSVVFGSQYILNGLVDKINAQIREEFDSEITFIDTKHVIASIGISNTYSNKNKYRWNYPYSQSLSEKIGMEIYKQYLITYGISKKCIVLDCDNVLWGGILSEDGIEGIRLGSSGLGREYRDFQRFLRDLYYHGVILTVCSKNDLTDVLQVFREHSGMILQEKYISCFMVNWESKPSNIERIADYLNIGLDSIVFVDDSPIEIESVKALLPEVTTIQFNKYMDYEPFSCFNLKYEYDTEDIEKRTQTYQTNGLRNELRRTSTDYENYVRSLNVVVDIHKALPAEFSRISELTQRTNKCTNGRRYTIEEIKERICDPSVSFYSVSVSDRFSDLGLVGAMEVDNNRLKLFNLSCRALGRDVERTMIEYLMERHNIKTIEFSSTKKNEAIKTFFEINILLKSRNNTM